MISQLGYLKKAAADLIYSAIGHGHSDLAQGIADGVTDLQTHNTTIIHTDRLVDRIRVTDVNAALVAQTIPVGIPITGFMATLKAVAKVAPTGSAAIFNVSFASTWGATPGAATTVEIAVGEYLGSQSVIVASDVVRDGLALIEVIPDSGGTCKDAAVFIEYVQGAEVTAPVADGRVVLVTWDFPPEDEGTITHFEIYRDGSKVWPIPGAGAPTDRSASIYAYWDSVYSLAACNGAECSGLADNLVAVFAPALANGQSATATSELTEGGITYFASNAVDGRSSTAWHSNGAGTQRLVTPLKANTGIAGYRLKLDAISMATAWTFELSDNGVDWTPVATVTGNADQVIIANGLTEASAAYASWLFTASASTKYVVAEAEVIGS